jgi:hypothetical protein
MMKPDDGPLQLRSHFKLLYFPEPEVLHCAISLAVGIPLARARRKFTCGKSDPTTYIKNTEVFHYIK